MGWKPRLFTFASRRRSTAALKGLVSGRAFVRLAVRAFTAAILVPASSAGPSRGAVAAADPDAVPDLVPVSIDRSDIRGDWQSLMISGRASVEVVNAGEAPVATPFEVLFFDDADRDGELDRGLDVVLGTAVRLGGIAPGARAAITAPVTGTVRFRDDRLAVAVDAGGEVAEADEGNNIFSSGDACRFVPPVADFEPELEWEWTGSLIDPLHDQVMMTPLVIDLDADQVPAIVFMTFDGRRPYQEDGRLRAIRGDGGGELFTVSDPRFAVTAGSSPAAGDIDGDGRPELVAVDTSLRRLIAFEHDGAFKWRTETLAERTMIGGPSIADLDGDGRPEIVLGTSVVSGVDGTTVWEYPRVRSSAIGPRSPSIIVDLDGDGVQEVVAGPLAFDASGRLLWRFPDADDGYSAVGNFDADPEPEIVLVTWGTVWVLEHDGWLKWGPVRLPPGTTARNHGGPPTVADVDGDGEPEIGVAGGRFYTVFETDGTVKWSQPNLDWSSHQTGSTVFDFEGDGSYEVIYSDEQVLRIFRGADGHVLWETPSTSGTLLELPVIADVDADGNAEIVMASNDHWDRDVTETRGIQVYGDAADRWVPTRQIWNQHAYHVTNVLADGTIPMLERPSWLEHNTYRTNLQEGGRVFVAPDVSASRIVVDTTKSPDSVILRARIGNGGANIAPRGMQVGFFAGEPGAGGVPIGEHRLVSWLRPGEFIDVEIEWPSAPPGDHEVWVVADPAGAVNECDESNNRHSASVRLPSRTPPTAPAPTGTPPVEPTGVLPVRPEIYLPIGFR